MTTETAYRNHRITHEGHVWRIDAKAWHPTGNRPGLFRVYRIHGDITNQKVLREALQLEADTLGLKLALS